MSSARLPNPRSAYAPLPPPPSGSLPLLPGPPQPLLAEDFFGTVGSPPEVVVGLLVAAGVLAAVAFAAAGTLLAVPLTLLGAALPMLVLVLLVRALLGPATVWGPVRVGRWGRGQAHVHLGAPGLPWARVVLPPDGHRARLARACALLPLGSGLATTALVVARVDPGGVLAGVLPGLLVGSLAAAASAQRLADALTPVPLDVEAVLAQRLGPDDDPGAPLRALADGPPLSAHAAARVDGWVQTLTGPEHRQSAEYVLSLHTGGSQAQRLLIAASVQHLVLGLDLLDGWSAEIGHVGRGRYARVRQALELLRHGDGRGALAVLPAGDDLWTRLVTTKCLLAEGERAAARRALRTPTDGEAVAAAWLTQEPFLGLAREAGLRTPWADAVAAGAASGRLHPVTAVTALALLHPERAVEHVLDEDRADLVRPLVRALAVTGEADWLDMLDPWLSGIAADRTAGVLDTDTAALARLAQGRPVEAERLWARNGPRASAVLSVRERDWTDVLRGRSTSDVTADLLLPADPVDLWLRGTACRVQLLGQSS